MHRLVKLGLPAIATLLSFGATAGEPSAPRTRVALADTLEVALVWSARPAGFALLAHPPLQFVAFLP